MLDTAASSKGPEINIGVLMRLKGVTRQKVNKVSPTPQSRIKSLVSVP